MKKAIFVATVIGLVAMLFASCGETGTQEPQASAENTDELGVLTTTGVSIIEADAPSFTAETRAGSSRSYRAAVDSDEDEPGDSAADEVTAPIEIVDFDGSAATTEVGIGEYHHYRAVLGPSLDATEGVVAWRVDSEDHVEVSIQSSNDGGSIVGVLADSVVGSTFTLTASLAHVSASITARITRSIIGHGSSAFPEITATNIDIVNANGTAAAMEIPIGGSHRYKAVLTPLDSVDEVTWLINSEYATVVHNDDGTVTVDVSPDAPEESSFAFSAAGINYISRLDVTITPSPVVVTDVEIIDFDGTAATTEIPIGSTHRYAAQLTLSERDPHIATAADEVTWSTNSDFVSVDEDGRVDVSVAASEGAFTLTISAGDISESVSITITEPVEPAEVPFDPGRIVNSDGTEATTEIPAGGSHRYRIESRDDMPDEVTWTVRNDYATVTGNDDDTVTVNVSPEAPEGSTFSLSASTASFPVIPIMVEVTTAVEASPGTVEIVDVNGTEATTEIPAGESHSYRVRLMSYDATAEVRWIITGDVATAINNDDGTLTVSAHPDTGGNIFSISAFVGNVVTVILITITEPVEPAAVPLAPGRIVNSDGTEATTEIPAGGSHRYRIASRDDMPDEVTWTVRNDYATVTGNDDDTVTVNVSPEAPEGSAFSLSASTAYFPVIPIMVEVTAPILVIEPSRPEMQFSTASIVDVDETTATTEIPAGRSHRYSAALNPIDEADAIDEVAWGVSSGDYAIVTDNDDGTLTIDVRPDAPEGSTFTLTAAAENYISFPITVTVAEPGTSPTPDVPDTAAVFSAVEIADPDVATVTRELSVGGSYRYRAVVTPPSHDETEVTWTISGDYATVTDNNDGTLTLDVHSDAPEGSDFMIVATAVGAYSLPLNVTITAAQAGQQE